MQGGIEDRGRRNVNMKPPVPGLAPRPPPPLPPGGASTFPTTTSESPVQPCANCALLREVLRQAHEQLFSAQTRINGAIILGKEAIERSSLRVGAYEILDRVHRQHGVPFEDGRPLPEEYTEHFPMHKYEDGIEEGRKARAARLQHTEDAEASPQSRSLDGSHGHRGDHADNSTSPDDSTEESDESIPPGFSPRSSAQSDDKGSEIHWDGESEDNRKWELDPQTLSGSDIGSGYTDDHEDRPAPNEGTEYDESGEESHEDGSDENEEPSGE